MIRSLFIFVLTGFSCLLFSSAVSITTPPPDTDAFSKLFIETLKKNDKELYKKTFALTEADMTWVVDTWLKNPYVTEKEKEELREKSNDLSGFWMSQEEGLTKSFDRIQKWILSDSIEVNAIEFVDFYYHLSIQKEVPFYLLHDCNLFIKHGTKYYKIFFEFNMFVNNQWKIGKIKKIIEVDKDLNLLSNAGYEYEENAYCSIFGICSKEISYDTVALDYYDESVAVVVDTALYPADSAASYGWHTGLPPLTEKQSKKAGKIQKKIDALSDQRDKIIYWQE
jgi:hypothetical protein